MMYQDLYTLCINPDTSKCMVINSKSQLKKITPLTLQIDNIIIENVNCQKILGVYVQNNLKLEAQYIHSYKQLNMKYYLLRRLTPYLTFETKKLFYNSYMLSQIDYWCVAWANGSSSSINKEVKF